jgi:hypothetical protein
MGNELEQRESFELMISTTTLERRAKRDDDHRATWHYLREQKLAYGGRERQMALNLTVRGEMIFYWSPTIDELKRNGDLYEALNLARECMVAIENDRTWDSLPLGWALKVAIIERKLGNYQAEVDVLERVLAANQSFPKPTLAIDVKTRLVKARLLLDKQTS